jgi:hypothetical protein
MGKANTVSRIPLTPLVARRAVLKCFEQSDQWSRRDLVRAIEKQHLSDGGLPGAQSVERVVRKALTELRSEGIAEPIAHGIWKYVEESDTPGNDEVPIGNPQDEEEPSRIEIAEQIGQGHQSVYLYYNPNDLRLAQLEQRSTWECKIGYTAGPADIRIFGQGVKTALSHPPVVALVIRSEDARALESILHRSLRLADAAIADAGTEWFMTSPNRIKAWYALHIASIECLVGDPIK